MTHHGFIHDMLDVKKLILFVTERLLYPVTEQKLFELCMQDDRISYFQVMEAIPQMLESKLLAGNENGLSITDHGREIAAVTDNALALPVRQRAEKAAERFNREIRRNSYIHTEVVNQPNGEALAVLHLGSEVGNLLTIEYACPTARHAAQLTRIFPDRANQLYKAVTEILTAKQTDETHDSAGTLSNEETRWRPI